MLKNYFCFFFFKQKKLQKKLQKNINYFSSFLVLDIKEINIFFLDFYEMSLLNFKYRGIFNSTDVITLKYNNNYFIYFSILEIYKNSILNKVDFFFEFFLVYFHGILHLLNYDHNFSKIEFYKHKYCQEKIIFFFKRSFFFKTKRIYFF